MLSGADVIGPLNEAAAGVPKRRKPNSEVVIWAVYALSSLALELLLTQLIDQPSRTGQFS
jgi:hypothetical protein